MRIATWNVNGLRARADFVKLWLRERQPDVVGFQELKIEDEKFPHDLFEAEGYRALTHGQKSWNGVAILTRGEASVSQTGLPGQEELGARLLTAEIGDLGFTTLYVPNGKHLGHEDFPRKLAWLDALTGHLDARHAPERPTVVCGDFNVCPGPLDSWNEKALSGEIFHTEEERKRLAGLRDRGFRDLFREFHPETQAFSWWDYRGGAFHRRQGLRIDLLLATEPVLRRTRTVEIDREWRKKHEGLTPSDHAPVWADLD
ncbi:MAG: exodeoxyribonuclease III [Myxococcota bacterium]|nr:exodeoxyribonuclease III [Myxococcota bacterium]